ncbi:MAG: hypothetical protein JZU63_12370 [Rhodoferax sp.]|nr:hypothetical protein [Rhodoferax sp.]
MSTANQDQLTVLAILCLGTGVCLFTLRAVPLNLECKKIMHLMVVVMLPAVAVFWTGETTMCAGTSSWYDFYSCLTAVQWLWHTMLVLSGFFLYVRHNHRITVAMPSIDKRFITEPVKNFLDLDPADDMILKVMSMVPILRGIRPRPNDHSVHVGPDRLHRACGRAGRVRDRQHDEIGYFLSFS